MRGNPDIVGARVLPQFVICASRTVVRSIIRRLEIPPARERHRLRERDGVPSGTGGGGVPDVGAV